MKILQTNSLDIEGLKIVRFARFTDHRGYFCETFRKSIVKKNKDLRNFIENKEILQCNESLSKKNTIRGMHFQWNPYMGKLVRTIMGHMIDLVLDIRIGSPSFGKILAVDMPDNQGKAYDEWILIPPGFAHGNCFLEDTIIEYLCTGEYNINCEASISPLAKDINWSMCNKKLKKIFDQVATTTNLITKKDKKGHTLMSWKNSVESKNFMFGKL